MYHILALDAPCVEHAIFISYVFPEPLSTALYPVAIRLADPSRIGKPAFGIVVDGQVVAACESVRENDQCGEAWVWTAPAFQRRGFARQATAAWAHDLQRQGKVPFFSHKQSNLASRAVAQRLNLIAFQRTVVYP